MILVIRRIRDEEAEKAGGQGAGSRGEISITHYQLPNAQCPIPNIYSFKSK